MSYRYMRNDLTNDYGFLELQDKILEIMVYVDRLCRDNDIEYCLMGGSALGAKRHGGFIPWDDDLDIFMTPDNYEKFRDVLKSDKNDKYYLQEWGATDGMVTISKVRMNGTTYLEPLIKEWDIHHGIYIDIFILHTCPDSKLLQLKQCFWAKYVIMKGLALKDYDRQSGLIAFAIKLMRLLPKRFLLKHGLKQIYKYRGKETNYYCNFLGKAVFKNGLYKREWFEKSKDISFETVMLRVPQKLEEFLTERFGDYMKLPSPERIKREQHAEEWSTKEDFQDVLGRKCGFKDEHLLIS